MKTQTAIVTALAAASGAIAISYMRRRSQIDFTGKVVLITGGSRGLGLALAREFGAHGATVAICARDTDELERAETDLRARGIRSRVFLCDITRPEQVRTMVAHAAESVGPIDVLVNNAGIIKVGPFSEMDVQDFDEAMKVMFWGPLHATLAVLPAMRDRRSGSIVNVTSIGGKVSVPHLLPYCCAKFASVALSEGLRTELAPEGIRVTTIVPGLLRTGSYLNVELKGRHAAEYAWFATGAATPLVSIDADRAARSIVRATSRGECVKILSVPADILARFHGVLPGLSGELMSLANRMLPASRGLLQASRTGHDVERAFDSKLWKMFTVMGRRAATSLNELRSPRLLKSAGA